MDIRLYDNYEEDGQLSMFSYDEPEFDMADRLAGESTAEKGSGADRDAADLQMVSGNPEIRIQRCSSCGKLLFVKEGTGGYAASCNNCGIAYFQKM